MAFRSHPAAGASHRFTQSLSTPSVLNGRYADDDDDFQISPFTQTSQRKPLQPTSASFSNRRPYKRPKQSQIVGKENAGSESGSHTKFGSGDHAPVKDLFGTDATQGCSLDCIPLSIDCCAGDCTDAFGSCEMKAKGDRCSDALEDKDGCFKVNRDSYLCNSIEARLLRPRLDPGFADGPDKDDGFVEDERELEVLMKLCSEENNGEVNLGEDGLVECPLCGMDISNLSQEQRQVHSNHCLDKADNERHEQSCLRKSEDSPFCMEESVDDPVRLPLQVTDVSPVLKLLRGLGLSKYEEVFAREEIDWATLYWLTEEDLLNIGITALGPRKKIVHALNELRNAHVSFPDAKARSVSTHASVTKTPTDKSSTGKASETKKSAANKLITEFFPGLVTEGKKIGTAPKEIVSEKSPSDTYGRRAVKRNMRNGKLKAIPQWCCIPGTPFRVDAFKYLRGDCCHWFLTHFHLDHESFIFTRYNADYQGLTKSFYHGKIYCSSITAKLINTKIGIPFERLQILQLGQKVKIAGIDVTCFDANHCPGSVMILFEPPSGKAVLHTGDFRYREEMRSLLNGYYINTLILDTTYCDPQYDFPKQEAVIEFVIEAIQAEAFNPKTLFLIGSYTIGKERLFLEVARVLRKKVYVNATKLRLLKCLGFSNEDMQWFTVNESESHVHVVPMWTLSSFKRLKHIANQYTNRFSLIVAFSPTGWTSGKAKKKSPGRRLQQGTIIRYEVPYSEHSSFTELKEFVKLVSPESIIPSVNNKGPESVASMVSLLVT